MEASSTKLVPDSDHGEEDNESDSDLEVLVIENTNSQNEDLMVCSQGRDEAEAESGEDVVPNYDDDSDEDTDENVWFIRRINTSEVSIVSPSPNPLTNSTTEDNNYSSEEEDKEEAKDLKDTAVENGKDESDVAMESDAVEDKVEDRTSDNGDNENFRINAPTSPKESEDSSSTSNSPDGSNVTTSPDITQQSPVRTCNKKVSISSDEDDDSQAVGVSVRSSASTAKKAKLSNDLDKEDSQPQPISTPSQSQPGQSKTRGRTSRGGKATPATADLSTRRVTRAFSSTIRKSSEETNTGSICLRSRVASALTKTRGRGAVTCLLPLIPMKETHYEVFLPLSLKKRRLKQVIDLSLSEKCLLWACETFLLWKPLLNHLKKRGIHVYLWVCNDSEEFSQCQKLGVTGIMTDHPTLLRDFLNTSKSAE